MNELRATISISGPRGKLGPEGPRGADGTVSFEELTPAQVEMLRGPLGIEGPRGPQGENAETVNIHFNTSSRYYDEYIDIYNNFSANKKYYVIRDELTYPLVSPAMLCKDGDVLTIAYMWTVTGTEYLVHSRRITFNVVDGIAESVKNTGTIKKYNLVTDNTFGNTLKDNADVLCGMYIKQQEGKLLTIDLDDLNEWLVQRLEDLGLL